jgi:hypothetical protein
MEEGIGAKTRQMTTSDFQQPVPIPSKDILRYFARRVLVLGPHPQVAPP